MAHVALRSVLSSYLKRTPSEVSFIVNAWGKPSIPGGPHFSLAHSDDLAVIAVDFEHEIGVDLETGPLALSSDEMAHVLSPDELAERRERDLTAADLLRLWVRKEAVLKALGKGVAHDPSRITVGFPAADFERWRPVCAVDDGVRHVFHRLDVRLGDATCAVARRDRPPPAGPIAFRNWIPPAL
ncbi:4'-phosphopantetheinyl transferase superfamily protein [Phenylobacterium sp.]|uniref:4'-phosphopantetheinyl transferase family protein n=1 Tax=Phenylobacterium sp. TaxID=1871053 RepID=UPI00289732D9|nr:4'-phosphopantetheinyl transferase superfamily protein [Phenylobacterium sp.]